MCVSIVENYSTTPVVVTDLEGVTLQRNLIHVGTVQKPSPISLPVRLMKRVHIEVVSI